MALTFPESHVDGGTNHVEVAGISNGTRSLNSNHTLGTLRFFPIAVKKYPDEGNLGDKAFILVFSSYF